MRRTSSIRILSNFGNLTSFIRSSIRILSIFYFIICITFVLLEFVCYDALWHCWTIPLSLSMALCGKSKSFLKSISFEYRPHAHLLFSMILCLLYHFMVRSICWNWFILVESAQIRITFSNVENHFERKRKVNSFYIIENKPNLWGLIKILNPAILWLHENYGLRPRIRRILFGRFCTLNYNLNVCFNRSAYG